MNSDDGLFEIQTRIDAITTATDAEQVMELITKLDWLSARARELKKEFELKLIEWISKNGDITLGDVRFYVGNNKKDKCNNVSGTVQSLFDAVGGEFDLFVEALSANAIKPGAARKILGDAKFAEFFDTIIEQDIKTGKPERIVHRVDSRFVKPAIVAKGES